MPQELNESEHKPKVVLFLGKDIPRLMKHMPELEQEISQSVPNRQVISHQAQIKLEHISDEPCDVVSICAHGNSLILKQEKEEKKLKTATSDLIEDSAFTVRGLLKIQSKKHNRHFDVMGCYQGALIQDIERNVNSFELGTTFTIHASAQYSTSSSRGNPILLNQLRQYEAGENDQAKLYGRYSKQTAETLFFVKIVKGTDNKNTMIAFKAISPKHAQDAQNLEEFGKREGIYQFGNKEHQHANLITLAGADHPEYQSLYGSVAAERGATPFSADYLHQTLELDKSRRMVRNDNIEREKDRSEGHRYKEALAETLLQKYQDIPDLVAKSYKDILIVKDEFLHIKAPYLRLYEGVVDRAMVHHQTIGGRDPVLWAIEENVLISQKPALVWAVESNKMINNKPAVEWAIENNKMIGDKSLTEYAANNKSKVGDKIVDHTMAHNQTIEGKHPIIWAIEKNIQVREKPALAWAVENNKMINNESAVEWAIKNDQKIEGRSALEFAIEMGKKFDGKLAIEWALDNNIKFDNQPVLEWAIEHRIKAGDLTALEYAVTNNLTVGKQPALDWAIDHHRTREFSEDLTSKPYILQYLNEENGEIHIEEIPSSYSIVKMAVKAMEKGGTIDGVGIDDWMDNYRSLFTQHRVFDQTPIEYAIEHDKKIKGFDTVGLPQIYDIEAIERAVENNDTAAIKTSLDIDPNAKDKYGRTPLTHALFANKPSSVRALLALGADPIVPDAYKRTALSLAVRSGKDEIVRALLESPHIGSLNNPKGTDLLLLAPNAKVVELLLQHKADPNILGTDGDSPLAQAVFTGNLAVVPALLKGGANPNIPAKNGVMLLHKAISLNQPEIVSSLLDAGANPHQAGAYIFMPAEYTNDIVTPLALATKLKSPKIISLLADKSVDLNICGRDGKTPLSIALSLIDKEYDDKKLNTIIEVVKTLLDKGANPNALNEDGSSALSMLKLSRKNSETKTKVFDLLMEAGVSFDTSPKDGAALLKAAVEAWDLPLIEKLFNHKANPNFSDEDGNSVLATAVLQVKDFYNPSPGLIKLLIKHGANIDTQDKDGVSLVQTAASFSQSKIMNILLAEKANPNLRDKMGNSPLSYLVDKAINQVQSYSSFEIEIERVQQFLQHPSVDPNALGKGDISPIESILTSKKDISFEGDFNNMKQLLQTLVDSPRTNVNLLNKQGISLLGLSIKNAPSKFVNILLEKADVNFPDADGTTPLHHAIKENRPALVKKLLAKGADPMAKGRDGVLPIKAAIDGLLSNKRKFGRESLYAIDDHHEIIKKLLVRTDPKQCPELLHYAIKSKNNTLIDMVLAECLDLSVKDQNGKTVLQYAMENNNTGLINKLVSKDKELNTRTSTITETPQLAQLSHIETALSEIKSAVVIHTRSDNAQSNVSLVRSGKNGMPGR